MNDEEIARVVDDLRGLIGASVGSVRQPSRDRVVIEVGDRWILMVPRGPFARLHTIRNPPRNPAKPFSFQGACRAHLFGPLTDVVKSPGDRVVDLHFGPRRLHLRLTGRSGGLWLLEGDRIVAAYDGPAPAALPALPGHTPRAEEPRFAPAPGQTWDEAAARWFGRQEAERRATERRSELERGLRKGLARSLRLAEGLRSDLDKASQAPRLRRMADALAANLHRVPRGTERVRFEDLEDASIVHEIPIDPGRPAAASLERLYGKARRLDRMGDRVLDHLDEVERTIARTRAALERLPEATDEELTSFEPLVPRTPEPRHPDAAPLPWTTWIGPRGERVLVGRNEAGNRRLTFQVARGGDWWMHLRGKPGAHLILEMDRGQSPPLELLLAAGQIALLHAKIPEGVAADVQYTRIKNVRSIPGEGARVILHDEKVLRVTRDPSALTAWSRD